MKNSRAISKRAIITAITLAAFFVLLTIAQDLFEAKFKQSSFYFSESLMFSSFWWIFIPGWYAQYVLFHSRNSFHAGFNILLFAVPVILHLVAFPALVWLLSWLFFEFTFRFQQTLQFTLSTHFYQLVLFYSVPILGYSYFRRRELARQRSEMEDISRDDAVKSYETALIVSDGSKKISIAVADILYFRANSPYIDIHHKDKTYLHNATLKAIASKIDDRQFVRVHKSAIVNISQVRSYTSRLNGDYDLSMCNGDSLRVSRNYVPDFKVAFGQSHRVAPK